MVGYYLARFINMRDPIKKHIEIRQQLEKEGQRLEQKKELRGALVHVLSVLFAPLVLFLLLLFNIKEE